MHDITDAAESSRTIMLGLNQAWIKKGGDFFVESPINFVTALIWFLCNYKKMNRQIIKNYLCFKSGNQRCI